MYKNCSLKMEPQSCACVKVFLLSKNVQCGVDFLGHMMHYHESWCIVIHNKSIATHPLYTLSTKYLKLQFTWLQCSSLSYDKFVKAHNLYNILFRYFRHLLIILQKYSSIEQMDWPFDWPHQFFWSCMYWLVWSSCNNCIWRSVLHHNSV